MTQQRDRVLEHLGDPEFVTAAQREAVTHDGQLLVEACPGAGKTRVTGLRLAWTMVEGTNRRVAATSFTNTAVDVMRASAASVGVVPAQPHFVGTLHDLFLRYVLYPFGHLVMGCEQPPRIRRPYEGGIPEVRVGKSRQRISADAFSYDADGNRTVDPRAAQRAGVAADQALQVGGPEAAEFKKSQAREGVVALADVMHCVRLVLEKHSWVAKALAARFDEIIVDEIQDSGAIQLRCLEALADAGLPSLVLAGDMDQAIYEFHDGSPDLVYALSERRGLQRLLLEDNFRCSQRICDVAFHLSSKTHPDTAAGPTANFDYQPELMEYDTRDIRPALEAFETRLTRLGLPLSEGCVLARTNSLASRINGTASSTTTPAPVRLLLEASTDLARQGFVTHQHVRDIDGLLWRMAWGPQPPGASSALRDASSSLIAALPDLNRPANDWIVETRALVDAALHCLCDTPETEASQRFRQNRRFDQLAAHELVDVSERSGLSAITVHKAKGQTHGSVLLVEGPPLASDSPWWGPASTGLMNEETRIRYVALTRARAFAAVAIPNTAPEPMRTALERFGFGSPTP